MKYLMILAGLASCATGWCSDDIELGNKLITFTNNEGHVYSDVLLQRANLDGIVYYTQEGGAGMVKYKDVDTNLMASLNIPLARLDTAAKREAADAARKKKYAEQLSALALKQQQDAAAQAKATAAAAQALAAQANAANAAKTNSPAPAVKSETKHHPAPPR